MNEEAMSTCLTSPVFGGSLRGVVSIDNFAPRRPPKSGDSYVFNTDLNADQHWFALLYVDGVWYLSDSTALTPVEDHLKIINGLRHNVDMQVGQLQAVGSMTCGEHSIGFLYFATRVDLKYRNLI